MADDDPQRIAEVMATMDEAFKMMDKGMSSDEILSAFKNTPRTKNAGGGLSYLMGTYHGPVWITRNLGHESW